jgi:hypothetical protein
MPTTEGVHTGTGPSRLRAAAAGEERLTVTAAEYDGMEISGRFDAAKGRLVQPRFALAAGGARLGVFLADYADYRGREGPEGRWVLTNGRLFFPSDLTPDGLVLRRSRHWLEFLSVRQITRLLALRRVRDPEAVWLAIQSRVADPVNNLVMLMIGLPFILSRERNIRASAALCLLMVGAFYVFIYVCRYMDLPAMWAAWLPVLLFGPLAVVMIDAIKT